MRIFEATDTRQAWETTPAISGTKEPGIADIVTTTLWSATADRFPPFLDVLEATGPNTAALATRLQSTPALAALKERSFEQYGDTIRGGQIKKSLRRALGW